MIYKWSQYNLATEYDECIILTNLIYFNSFKIKKDSNIYTGFLSNSVEGLSDSEKEYLYNNYFLTESSVDEKILCDYLRARSVYSDSSLYLTILPTDACNFRCVYCYESATNTHLSDENEKNIIKFIKKNIKQYKYVRVSWFGGEPLVRKEQVIRMSEEINEICKMNGVLFSGQMTTNAYELDINTFNTLVRNRILAFQICIDGNRESHNRQRPHVTKDDSYQRIMENIKNIENHANTNTFLITLRSNIAKETEPYLESYLNEIYNIVGNDKRFEIVFQGVRNWGGSRIDDKIVNIVDNESLLYEKWYLKAAEIGLNSAEVMNLSVRGEMCAGNFQNGYIINPDCSVHKCTLSFFGDENTREMGRIGQIKPDGTMEVDISKNAKWLSHYTTYPKCEKCVMYVLCKGGSCPYSSNIIGNPIHETRHCQELMALVKSKIKCQNLKNMISEYKGGLYSEK